MLQKIKIIFLTFILLSYITAPLQFLPPLLLVTLPQINSSSVSLKKIKKNRPSTDMDQTWLNKIRLSTNPHITAVHGNPVGGKGSQTQAKVSEISSYSHCWDSSIPLEYLATQP